MGGRIVGLVCCLMCAFPFLIFSLNEKSREPIPFWSGDNTLKSKLENVQEYNREMARLYKKYAAAWGIAGIACLLFPVVGVILVLLDCTLGLYLMFREYKRILGLYGRREAGPGAGR